MIYCNNYSSAGKINASGRIEELIIWQVFFKGNLLLSKGFSHFEWFATAERTAKTPKNTVWRPAVSDLHLKIRSEYLKGHKNSVLSLIRAHEKRFVIWKKSNDLYQNRYSPININLPLSIKPPGQTFGGKLGIIKPPKKNWRANRAETIRDFAVLQGENAKKRSIFLSKNNKTASPKFREKLGIIKPPRKKLTGFNVKGGGYY